MFGLLGDLDDDPFLSGHVRRMNSLMSSFLRDPFADMFGGGGGRGGAMNMLMGSGGGGLGTDLMPFHPGRMPSPAAMMLSGGFPSILDQMGATGGNGHVSSMSTVMTMTHGPDGRPQVYQASQSVRQGPGGVRETKKTVADSRTGVKKMSIGRHVYDRGHIVEREQNMYSGDREENEEFINLDEDEAEDFNKEWETKARNMMHNRNTQAAIGYGNNSGAGSHNRRRPHQHHHHHHHPQMALPSTVPTQHQPAAPQPSQSNGVVAAGIDDLEEEEPPKKMKKKEPLNVKEIEEVEEIDDDDEEELIQLSDDDDEDEVVEELEDEEEEEDSDNENDCVQVLNTNNKNINKT